MGTRPDLGEASAESGEHFLHVAPFLHGDDPQVVLLVDPHQESLIVIVPGEGVQSSQNPSQNTVLDHIQNDTVWVTLKQKASQVTEVLILERYRSVSCRQTPIPATLEEGRANGAPITWCVAGEGLKQAEQAPTPPRKHASSLTVSRSRSPAWTGAEAFASLAPGRIPAGYGGEKEERKQAAPAPERLVTTLKSLETAASRSAGSHTPAGPRSPAGRAGTG